MNTHRIAVSVDDDDRIDAEHIPPAVSASGRAYYRLQVGGLTLTMSPAAFVRLTTELHAGYVPVECPLEAVQ